MRSYLILISSLMAFALISHQAFSLWAKMPTPSTQNNFKAIPLSSSLQSKSTTQAERKYLGASCERSNDSYRCMLCNCMRESAHEPLEGKVMVGLSVKTRLEVPARPKTICGVIYEYKQYSWTIHRSDRRSLPRKTSQSFKECIVATNQTMNAPGNGIDHYHADYVSPYWAKNCTRAQKIGRHIFYKNCSGKRSSKGPARSRRSRGTR